MKLRNFTFLWKFWPPFLGLGISIKHISKDFKKVTVLLKKRPWNANYFGTQYGGGIFCMTDGVLLLMLIRNLPKGYRLWDKSAKIDYQKRGLTQLTAEFIITDQELADIQHKMSSTNSMDFCKTIDIHDADGQVVATVERTISIKKK